MVSCWRPARLSRSRSSSRFPDSAGSSGRYGRWSCHIRAVPSRHGWACDRASRGAARGAARLGDAGPGAQPRPDDPRRHQHLGPAPPGRQPRRRRGPRPGRRGSPGGGRVARADRPRPGHPRPSRPRRGPRSARRAARGRTRGRGRRGTTVVAWPDGDLAAYLASLRRLAELGPAPVLPGHGPALADCAGAATYYLQHRLARLDQVRAARSAGAATAPDVVKAVYADVDRALWPAAELSVRAQLAYLEAQARESRPPAPELDRP